MFRRLLPAVVAAAAMGAAAPAPADIVAHWTFDAFEGNNFPDSTGKHTASPKKANAILQYTAADAPFGKGITLNGGPECFLEFPGFTEIQESSFTVAVWVNIPTPGPSFILTDWPSWQQAGFSFAADSLEGGEKPGIQPVANLVSNMTAGGGGGAGGAARGGGGRAGGRAGGGAGGGGGTQPQRQSIIRLPVPGKTIPLNSWHHLAWTWDRGERKLTAYFDGMEVGSGVKDMNVNPKTLNLAINNRNMRIGSREMSAQQGSNTPVNFVGSLDEMWVFNTALKPEQIANLKNANNITGVKATPAVVSAQQTPTPSITNNTNTIPPIATPNVRATPTATPDAPHELAATKSPTGLSTTKLFGIILCLLLEVGLISYLAWGFKMRARLRAAGRL